MSRRGQVFENPVTGERSVLLTEPDLHPDKVLVAHLFVRPGGRVAAEHWHPGQRERFHVLGGQVAFAVDGQERTLGPGEMAEVPAGVRHDWWQVGDDEAQVLVEVAPGDRFGELVSTMFGLARDGKTNKSGLPDLLQLAVSASAYRDTVVFTAPPLWVQRVVFGALAPVGRALGRKACYPEYLASSTVVEPDPVALSHLTPEGCLRFADSATGTGG